MIMREGTPMTKECFRRIYRIFPKPLERLLLKAENAIIYIFYGTLTTLVNYVTHFGLRIAFADIPAGATLTQIYEASQASAVSSSGAAAAAWIAAVVFSFFVNKYFVFEKRGRQGILKEFAAFTAGRLFSFGCEVAIMFVFVDRLGLNELVIKLASNVLVLIMNYFISKLLVFRQKPKEHKG